MTLDLLTYQRKPHKKSDMTSLYRSALAAFFLSLSGSALSQVNDDEGFSLSLPVDCAFVSGPNQDGCWLQTLMDHNPGLSVDDYLCSARSYNASSRFGLGHQGLDIGPLDWVGHKNDIPVLAAAPGRVLGIRDGVDDFTESSGFREAQENGNAPPSCGNGVSIDHGNNWVTQYCHMQKGSVMVAIGDTVSRGAVIGLIGVSGQTSHPHLHFQLMRRIKGDLIPYDPYDGTSITQSCADRGQSMWDDDAKSTLAHTPMAMIKLGFTDKKVNDTSLLVDLRTSKELDVTGPITVFAYIAGGHPGAKVSIEVRDPNGDVVLSGTKDHENYRTRQWVAAKLNTARRFHMFPGEYELSVSLTSRAGQRVGHYKVQSLLTGSGQR